MIAQRPNATKSKWSMDTILPTLLTFGPVFMLIGLQGAGQSHGPFEAFEFAFAAVGAVMLSVGLASLFAKQVRLEHRLDEMEQRRESSSPQA